MKKYILYPFLVILSFVGFSSCGGDNDADFSVAGHWIVLSRDVKCTIDSTGLDEYDKKMLKADAKALEIEINNGFLTKFKEHTYIYTFGSDEMRRDPEGRPLYEYFERGFKSKKIEAPLCADMILNGYYGKKEEGLSVGMTNLAHFGNWGTDMRIEDLNNQHVMLTQQMSNADLEILLFVYFDANRKLNSRIKARMVTKAWNTKKDIDTCIL